MKHTYLLFKAVALMLMLGLFIPGLALAQNQITGIVTDETQMPLPGVSVMIKGSAGGTSTKADGSFSISATANQTLVFSFIGSDTQEVLIGNKSKINVQLILNRKH